MHQVGYLGAAAMVCLLVSAGGAQAAAPKFFDANLKPCIQRVMKLDEGRWSYTGTIATLNGKFRTYAATSVHAPAGDNVWSSQSFGGDVGGTEDQAEKSLVTIMGDSVVPLTDGEPDLNRGVRFLSCQGPDAEGRYAVTREYRIPNGDGTYDLAKNTAWYSAHGSYFAEDHFNEEGRMVARRSGVYTPSGQ